MRQRTLVSAVVAVAALTVFASVATAAATGFAGESGASAPALAATDGAATDSVSPGQRLTGVIGAQRAEVEGEIESRTFDVRVSSASSPRAKAGVVAEEVTDLEGRLETLQNRRTELERAHENGNVSDGVYRARATELAARIETTKRLVDTTDAVANDLPENDLEAAGVRRANIAQLRQRAANLSERETADLARSVVGDDVGSGMGVPADANGSAARGNGGPDGPGGDANAVETGAPGRENGRSDGRTLGGDASGNATADASGNGSANASAGAGTDDGGANATVGAGVDGDGVDVDADVNAETTANETTADETVPGETTAETGTSTAETTTTDGTTENGFLTDWAADETQAGTETSTTEAGIDETATETTTSTDETGTDETTTLSETRTAA